MEDANAQLLVSMMIKLLKISFVKNVKAHVELAMGHVLMTVLLVLQISN